MKNLLLYSVIIATLLSCQPTNDSKPGNGDLNSFSSLLSMFKNPPVEYASAPLWVWNDEMTEEEISKQLAEFKSVGIEGVYVHPRPGLITDYLSDRWNELFRYTVDKAKELEMLVWIYDENSYPSGFAGGHVPAQMPESYKHGNGLRLHKQKTLNPDPELEYKFIFKKENDTFIDVTAKLDEEKGKDGDYYLYELTHYRKADWHGGYSYVDLLHKGVTQKFIEVTMKGYEEVAGDEFGKTIPGLFTDEPNISAGKPADAVRWTPDLFAEFEKRWGYKLQDNLLSLFENEGDYQKVRHNYYSVLLQLFIDRWAKPCFEYCEEKNLLWTGHYWEHGWPHPQHGGDNMAMYAWHQQPGIDMLFNNFNDTTTPPGTQFGNIRSVKELASVANQYGYRRTLSETYGGGGWMVTFEDLKRLGDWEYVLGVNHMNQHLSFSTLQGSRKYDYPPSFSYHEPWFEHYKVQADYYKRLSLALSSGEQINDILVIEPTTSAWMYSINMKNPRGWGAAYPDEAQEIGDKFHEFLRKLEADQVEYDLGSENIIKDVGSVSNNEFVVNKRAYKMVVLPPGMENIDAATFGLLEEYVKNGGKLIVLEKPARIDGSENVKLQELFNRESVSDDDAAVFVPREDFAISWNKNGKGKLYHMRRQFSDGQLIFLVNSSLKNKVKGSLNIPGKQLILLDLFNGNMYELAANAKDGVMQYQFELLPAGSKLIFVADNPVDGLPEKKPGKPFKNEVETAPSGIKRTTSNALTINYLDIKWKDVNLNGVHFDFASDTLFKYHGFENGNPWFHAIQYKSRILDRDTFKTGTGFKASYHFKIAAPLTEFDLSTFKAVVENFAGYTISVNGNKVDPISDSWWIDRFFPQFAIGEHLKQGKNTISFAAEKMSVFAEIVPVFITGNFYVKSIEPFFEIIPASELDFGSWKEQGMPFYYHAVEYSKSVKLDKENQYIVQLDEWEGILAEVLVNGKSEGIIFQEPWQFNISNFTEDGNNIVTVKVYGSLKNLFGPHHNDKIDISGPWDWKYAPEIQPNGKDYIFFDYGLMKDFKILTN